MSPEKSRRILIVAGEASGDLHGAHMIRSLKRIDPSLSIYGIGGEELSSAGVDIMYHFKDLAVVGILEVVSRLPKIGRVFRYLKKELSSAPPDLVILIDYPDFNLRLAKIAKKNQVPIFYYISPQIWAWRKKRAKTIARLVDMIAVVFPFEVPLYEKEGLRAQFVGHPLLDQPILSLDHSKALEHLQLENVWPIIGLLPGSRNSEIERLLPLMLDAAAMILKQFPLAQFIIHVASGIREEDILRGIKGRNIRVKIFKKQLYQVLTVCHLVLVASGTATLQTAIMQKPMIILYKVSWLTYFIGKMMIRVPFIGMVNIVAGKKIVPELIQNQATPEKIAQESLQLLNNTERREIMATQLQSVKEALGEKGASQRVAHLVFDILNRNA
jgi:lipid-A-disaccharide synthase